MPLVVRPSPIHAVGVYTTAAIRKGTRIVEYAGERITPEEADRRYEGVSRTYLYGLEDGNTVIDGHGLGAYLNHSCDPKKEPVEQQLSAQPVDIEQARPNRECGSGPAPCGSSTS